MSDSCVLFNLESDICLVEIVRCLEYNIHCIFLIIFMKPMYLLNPNKERICMIEGYLTIKEVAEKWELHAGESRH